MVARLERAHARLRFPSGHATATVISVLHDHSEHLETSAELSWEAKIRGLLVSFGASSAYVPVPGDVG
jgi:uncharacterized oligopeptide transporter (OPT) family protein